MEYTFYKLSIADKCYIGSTTNFDNRMKNHKNRCNNENNKKNNYKVYQYIRDNGNWENVKVMIIDKIIYNNKEQALDIETKFMLSFNAELNTQYPKRSKKERYETNKQSIIEKQKQYNEENREKVIERKKEYYENNKQKISEKQKEKITCDICSKLISRSHIARHKKTQH
jgi:hypothetical protein